ncbi:MAG: TonB-dependent receptor plug domain-containing protein, partial [bacterium]|nr:TonB-dependent receptor plug domain-containing protein [bacterium]
AEQLKAIPGVLAVRRGATNMDPVVQGLRESQLAMVVDGTRTFAAGPARMDSELSHVASGFVEELEVVKGPYALSAGSGALSAVIVRTSPVPYYDDWTFGGVLSAGYSTNGTDRFGRASLFGANRRFGFRLRGVGDKGNNYSAGDRGGVRASVPGRHTHHQLGGKLRYSLTDSQELLFDGAYDEQTNVDFPGRLLNAVHFLSRSWNGAYHINAPSPTVES